ncbi:hypothetical protein BH10PSE19_BH10PSE19_21170 [soil metagenome]
MNPFIEPISEFIWDTKYRYRLHNNVIDNDIENTWWRVANGIAQAEKYPLRKLWAQNFLDILHDFRFLPGGRILAGTNTQYQVTLFNCYVMGKIKDSIPGIFTALQQGALTLQQGGGVGYDFSTLRPHGSNTDNNGGIASGPVSFMRIWDAMCATMQSTGARRGAMMAVLRCDHPDIEEFIAAKADAKELRHFNVSVAVTDAFMRAVHDDTDWPLVFKQQVSKYIRARKLWEQMMQSAYDYAEPGILFIDTINRLNNLRYCEHIAATNPCGEVPLPSYGACDLGSINLTQFVSDAFTPQARLNWHGIEAVAATAIRLLDNVIDISNYPLKAQQNSAQHTRRIGLGFTGMADMLIMLGIRYGSTESLNMIQKITQTIRDISWDTSISLAAEKGSCPAYDAKKYLQGEFVKTLPEAIRSALKHNGVRNSHHNVIAPTGTISLLANNISSGLEPIFATCYNRHVLTSEGSTKTFVANNYTYNLWRKLHKAPTLPPAWIDAQSLNVEDHLAVLHAVQPYIDGAISKTIFIPKTYPYEMFKNTYLNAYALNFKGCTVFRDNAITGNVLSVCPMC